MENKKMPELPRPAHAGPDGTGCYFSSYTKAQMHEYAIAYAQEQNKALAEALQSMDRVLLDENHNCSPEFLFKQIQNAFGIGRTALQEAGAA